MKKILELISKLGITFVAIDKQAHFIVGFIISVISYLLTKDVYLSFYVTFLAGLLKELKDEYVYGGFDYKDLFATCLGGSIIFITLLF